MTESTPEGKLLNLIKDGQSKIKTGKDVSIFKKINLLLTIVIGIIGIIFLADVLIFRQRPVEKPAVEEQVQLPELKPVTQDMEEYSTNKEAGQDNNIEPKKVSKEGIAGNLNLLGIITGDNNQAIIEDKILKKTFFLYKGDLMGELKVYDIKDSVVIFDYKGEKIELKI